MNCPHCESWLLVEVYGTSNPIRCTSCGGVSIPPNKTATQVNRYAWRSFWFGLASIVLLFVAGIPAIWYGVRSLLQMRFTRSQKSDRKAAVAGVALGVVFGVFGTGLATVIGAIVFLVMSSIEETSDPQRMNEILASIGTLDVPEGVELLEANRFQNQFQRINWRDGSSVEKSEARIRLIKAIRNTQVGMAQLNRPRDSFSLHSNIEVDAKSRQTEMLLWKFAGKEREITKSTEPVVRYTIRSPDSEDEEEVVTPSPGELNVITYSASTEEDGETNVYILLTSFRDPGKHSEEAVRAMFESFQPKQ